MVRDEHNTVNNTNNRQVSINEFGNFTSEECTFKPENAIQQLTVHMAKDEPKQTVTKKVIKKAKAFNDEQKELSKGLEEDNSSN